MKRAILALSLLTTTILAGAAACSSSSPKSSGGSDAGSDAGNDVAVADTSVVDVVGATDTLIVNPNNCVAPGTPSNAEGIGGYCNPNGGQCNAAGPGGTPTLCSADYGAPDGGWFCTYPCTSPATCGTGMLCVETAQGSGCVPQQCLSIEGDGGYTILDGGDGGTTPNEAGGDTGAGDTGTGDAGGE